MRNPLSRICRRVLGRDLLARFGLQLVVLEKRLDRTDAALDVLLEEREYASGVGVGMNGQVERKHVVAAVCAELRIELVVETGAFFGFTSGFFARDMALPVKTCEVGSRYFAVARRMLRNCPAAEVRHCDSRVFLRELSQDREVTGKRVLFYLDAHWYDSLPLGEELGIILANWPFCCILIDDFAVPWDIGYGSDDYGEGKALNFDLIREAVYEHQLAVFLPSVPSAQETGGRRGCVLVAGSDLASTLEHVAGLRRYR